MPSKLSIKRIKTSFLSINRQRERGGEKMPLLSPTTRKINFLIMSNNSKKHLFHPTMSHKSKRLSINTLFSHSVAVRKSISFSKRWSLALPAETLIYSSRVIKVAHITSFSKGSARSRSMEKKNGHSLMEIPLVTWESSIMHLDPLQFWLSLTARWSSSIVRLLRRLWMT